MPTLNRFPLLGLWAKEAALHLGYAEADARTLGHAYAVLYAIRAQSAPFPKHAQASAGTPEKTAPQQDEPDEIDLGGDLLEVKYNEAGELEGFVGRGTLQTPRTYQVSVQAKFSGDYYDRLEQAFHDFWQTLDPQRIQQGRLIYKLYDQWKKNCAAGRLVDLDRLLDWCEERASTA
jgi:hypothetical protein